VLGFNCIILIRFVVAAYCMLGLENDAAEMPKVLFTEFWFSRGRVETVDLVLEYN
jgi:hypothetical protein